jgi:hypothetical protein
MALSLTLCAQLWHRAVHEYCVDILHDLNSLLRRVPLPPQLNSKL